MFLSIVDESYDVVRTALDEKEEEPEPLERDLVSAQWGRAGGRQKKKKKKKKGKNPLASSFIFPLLSLSLSLSREHARAREGCS